MHLVAVKALLIFDLTTGAPAPLNTLAMDIEGIFEIKKISQKDQDKYTKYDYLDIDYFLNDDYDDELVKFINDSIQKHYAPVIQE